MNYQIYKGPEKVHKRHIFKELMTCSYNN